MSRTRPPFSAFFTVVQGVEAALGDEVGPDEAAQRIGLVRELVARLPHMCLLTATRAEIQAAGRTLRTEGQGRKELRALQDTITRILDGVVDARLLPSHPLRVESPSDSNGGPAPEVALAVGVPASHLDELRLLVEASGVSVYAEKSHRVALERVRWYPFCLVLSTPPSVAPATFLQQIRSPGSLCRSTGVVLLARDAQIESATTYLGRGANRALLLSELGAKLPAVLTELGMISERVRVRLRVDVDLDEGRRSERWLSENLSATGMLLRTLEREAVGTLLDLHFAVPGDALPIHARGEVVRQTTFAREDFTGVGVRFLSFVGEGQHRLSMFLRKSTA